MVGLAGRRAGGGGAGLRAAVAAGLSAPAGGLSAPEDGAALGSALMMLTGGIEADEGKNRPGLPCGAEVAGAELGGVIGEAAGGSAAATAESGDCGHSEEWCNM